MVKLSIEERNFVVHRRHEGHGYRTIVGMLKARGISVCKTTIMKLCKKFEVAGVVTDKKRVRACIFGSDDHRAFIDRCMTDHPDMTARVLSNRVFEVFNLRISESRVNAVRRECGWLQYGTRYCQMIRNENKVKRLEWCQRMLETQETFDVRKLKKCLLIN